ncbi:extracellular solute-binding protein [Vibrio zhugei]|uniref:Extracellular solute-binding protein n=1 Tax=Vibrio zhugei TaxID=2479546 RepID=A0ABV7CCB9_9VIBR|nr:extracellular solute-binding protein [Vibrio zhugei]
MKGLSLTTLALLSALSSGVSAANLPTQLQWIHHDDEPLFASDKAQFGGTFHTFMMSFPQTLRSVGPDANSGFRAYLMDNVPKLAGRHPNTGKWIPQLATAWAYGDDHQTVYFKLDPQARWSDGEKVTADDYLFMLTYNRSKDIVDPWYNDFFTNKITDVIKYDDYTIAIKSATKMTHDELMIQINMPSNGVQPRPKHFFAKIKNDKNHDGIPDDFVRRYNFKTEPTTGPYYIDKIKRGKQVVFKHVKNWWGYHNRYYKNRYNVEKVNYRVIRDADIARKHFERGNLDTFGLVLPSLWHEKSNTSPYQNGYIDKFWGYNQTPQGAGGLWMNTKDPLLSNRDIRAGITYATDVDGMIKQVLRGDYMRLPSAMGYGHGDYDIKDETAPTFDPKRAIEFFNKAGFDHIGPDGIRINDKGQRLSVAITYSSRLHTRRIAYLKEQAKKAGLEFTLNLLDGSSAFKYMLEKKHQIAFLHMGGGEVPAYWEYLDSVNAKPQSNNFTNYSNPQMDQLIDQYDHEFDVKAKQKLSHQILEKVANEYLIVPGYMVPYTREAYWRWLKFPKHAMTKRTEGLFSPIGISNFWIDSQTKEETQKAIDQGKTFPPVTIIDDRFKMGASDE